MVNQLASFTESSIVFQDSLRKKDDRIEELEEALRESVQITAEREMVLAQEESARTSAEKQVCDSVQSQAMLLGKGKVKPNQCSLGELDIACVRRVSNTRHRV